VSFYCVIPITGEWDQIKWNQLQNRAAEIFPLLETEGSTARQPASITAVGGVFCFDATAGRGESQARQPSTESFCRQKDTYTG